MRVTIVRTVRDLEQLREAAMTKKTAKRKNPKAIPSIPTDEEVERAIQAGAEAFREAFGDMSEAEVVAMINKAVKASRRELARKTRARKRSPR